MNSIELFAGGGGLALAVAKAGFIHSFLVEWDKDSVSTIRSNKHSLGICNDGVVYHGDIKNVDFNRYSEKIDLLSGGPPCQPFSLGGKSQAFLDRRDMFPQAARALLEIKPRAFLFENVRGLLRKNFSRYFNYIILQLSYPEILAKKDQTWEEHLSSLERHHTGHHFYEGLKYNVLFRLLNAADYGIPQKRERVFIVGFRSDINGDWCFPEATHSKEALDYSKYVVGDYWEKYSLPRPEYSPLHIMKPSDKKPWKTIRDALYGMPDPREGNNNLLNHKYQPGAKVYAGHTGSCLDEPAKTIKAGAHGVPGGENMLVLDDGTTRYFTIREAARLQTFPDNYLFPGSWTESMRQIGNAVPVQLGTIVAQSISKKITYGM